jgi:hypothetical protein
MTCYLHFKDNKFVFHTHDIKLIDSSYLVISTVSCLEPEINNYEIKDDLLTIVSNTQSYDEIESQDDINLMKSKIATLQTQLDLSLIHISEPTRQIH